MKLSKLLKYSLVLLIFSLIAFFILTLYIYYFSNNPAVKTVYAFVVPISIFLVSIMYSRSIRERGLLRVIELWLIYFAIILLMKVILKYPAEIKILYNSIVLASSILGGIIGVNLKNKKAQV